MCKDQRYTYLLGMYIVGKDSFTLDTKVKSKATLLLDGFIDNPINVHIEQRQRSKKIIAFAILNV